MKQLLSFSLLLVITAQSVAQDSFSVDGVVTGLEDGAVIWLMKFDGNVGSGVASDTVQNEQFHFNAKVSGDNVEEFGISGYGIPGFPPMNLQVFAKAGSKIAVSGSNKLLKTWQVKSDVPEQKEYDGFVQNHKTHWDQYQLLMVRRAELFKDINNVTEEESSKRKPAIEAINRQEDSLSSLITREEIKMLQKAKPSVVTMKFMKQAAMRVKFSKDEKLRKPVEDLYSRLTKEQRASAIGQDIWTLLYPPTVVQAGEQMADTIFSDISGATHKLADFKGKFILLDFWSIGCGPCIMAMPELKELSEKYRDTVEVVSITVDTKKVWLENSESTKITWHNFSDGRENRGIAAKYGVQGIPHYAMISPDGKLIASWVGYGKGSLLAKLEELLKSSFAQKPKL